MVRQFLTITFGLLLEGCALSPTPENPSLTVHTSPEAATIVEVGSGIRYSSPAVFNYQRPAPGGCLEIRGFVAHWISGATARTDATLKLCGNSASYQITIDRPRGTPGLEYDIQEARAKAYQESAANGELGRTLGQALGRSLRN